MALNRRIHAINPGCQRCGQENEFVMHLLFYCPLSRVTWYGSHFSLQIEGLPLNFAQTLMEIIRDLTDEQIAEVCNMMWCLWKARNEDIFSGTKPTWQGILAQVRKMEKPSVQPAGTNHQGHIPPATIPRGKKVILVDASWDPSHTTGTAMIMYDEQGERKRAQCTIETTHDPFQAEATATFHALEFIHNRTLNGEQARYMLYTDCKLLVNVLASKQLQDMPSWRATESVVSCLQLIDELHQKVTIAHMRREALHQPHSLANWARRNKKGFYRYDGQELQGVQMQQWIDPTRFTVQRTEGMEEQQ